MKTHTTIENELKASRAIPERLHLEGMPSTSAIHQKDLFADSLLETPGEQRASRASAVAFSLLFQCSLAGVLLLIPLMFTEVLPRQQLMTFLTAPPPPPPPPPPAAPETASRKVVKVASDISNGQLRTPMRIPKKVQIMKEDDAPPPVMATGGVVGGVPGGIPGGPMGVVIGGITAIIDKDGNIENLQVVSGHPMLAPAAINAVKPWRYKPYPLSGQPVEVETTITVNSELRG
jgi:periplasmic protein TonB